MIVNTPNRVDFLSQASFQSIQWVPNQLLQLPIVPDEMLPPELGMMTSECSKYLEALQLIYFIVKFQAHYSWPPELLELTPVGLPEVEAPNVEVFGSDYFLLHKWYFTSNWIFSL